MDIQKKKVLTNQEQIREERRDFLAKCRYAAYMSPLMLSMVVNKNAHARSGHGHGHGHGRGHGRGHERGHGRGDYEIDD